MSKFKPFLEVIVEMQNGDIADCERELYPSIRRDENGFFYEVYSDGSGSKWNLETGDLDHNFKIRPRYVGWDEAQKALMEGKTVEYCDDKGLRLFQMNAESIIGDISVSFPDYATFADLFNGRFIIIED